MLVARCSLVFLPDLNVGIIPRFLETPLTRPLFPAGLQRYLGFSVGDLAHPAGARPNLRLESYVPAGDCQPFHPCLCRFIHSVYLDLEQQRGSLLLICLFHSFDNTIFTLSAVVYPYLIDQYWYYLAVLAILLVPIIFFSDGKLLRKRAFPKFRA